MRVIAGTARHLNLETPRGNRVRPTTDRIKETLFNMLQPRIPGAAFLDLFAGSGGIGIEALSRGASLCVFGDRDRQALNCIRANLEHTGLEDRAEVIAGDYSRTLALLRGRAPFDIIFMDPPYDSTLVRQALKQIADSGLLAGDGVIVAEVPANEDLRPYLGDDWLIAREKVYKTNKHVFIEQGEEG